MIGVIISAFAGWLGSQLLLGRIDSRTVWEKFKGVVTSWWAVVVAVAGWIMHALVAIKDSIIESLAAIAAMVLPSMETGIGEFAAWAAMANTVFPLAETMVMLVSLLLLMLGCTIYKLVKSWIPGGFG